jgi:hypothetical protein
MIKKETKMKPNLQKENQKFKQEEMLGQKTSKKKMEQWIYL